MSEAVMIVAGESSGELYGALLARAIKGMRPSVEVMGVGGERMREAGVNIFAGISSAFGLLEAVSSLRKVKQTFDKTIDMMKKAMPAVVVLIDYPDFNLRVAKEAKRLGIKVLYYVSPQVWAWRKGRVKTIGELSEKVCVLLPFEEAIYREAGIPCEFVGHPILEEMESISASEARRTLGIEEGVPLLALLPGSRPHELNSLLPLLMEVVREFKKEFPAYKFILPLAPNLDAQKYSSYLTSMEKEGVRVINGNAILALSASDTAVVASGTATLQTAFLERPMVVIYKVSPLSYFLGRLIIKVKHISLVNLMLGKTVVTELIQNEANTANIMLELKRLISDNTYRDEMIQAFRDVKAMYAGKRPSMRVAGIIGDMAGWGAASPGEAVRPLSIKGTVPLSKKGSMTP